MAKYRSIIALAEELDRIDKSIEERINDIGNWYQRIGEIQATSWEGELLWEDDEKTVPKMTSEYGYVPKDTLSDEDKEAISALRMIQKHLEKLL